MLVIVGSKNAAKLQAVERGFARYFQGVGVKGAEVESGVSDQPLALQEIIRGAVNRAKNAWGKAGEKCDYSVGMEAGLFEVPGTRTGYMDVAAVAVFDGNRVYLGLTPAFEYPRQVLEKILKEGKEVSDVFLELWNDDTRDSAGAIGRLSEGAVPRPGLLEMGLLMALVQVVNKKHYRE